MTGSFWLIKVVQFSECGTQQVTCTQYFNNNPFAYNYTTVYSFRINLVPGQNTYMMSHPVLSVLQPVPVDQGSMVILRQYADQGSVMVDCNQDNGALVSDYVIKYSEEQPYPLSRIVQQQKKCRFLIRTNMASSFYKGLTGRQFEKSLFGF